MSTARSAWRSRFIWYTIFQTFQEPRMPHPHHPHLMVERHPAGYSWLRLARERRNALDVALMTAVRDAIAAEPAAPVLLGNRVTLQVFCAGADLTITDAERAVISDIIYDCCEAMITRPGAVIAVVTGAAVGGGVSWRSRSRPADRQPGSPAAVHRATRPGPGRSRLAGPDLVGRARRRTWCRPAAGWRPPRRGPSGWSAASRTTRTWPPVDRRRVGGPGRRRGREGDGGRPRPAGPAARRTPG